MNEPIRRRRRVPRRSDDDEERRLAPPTLGNRAVRDLLGEKADVRGATSAQRAAEQVARGLERRRTSTEATRASATTGASTPIHRWTDLGAWSWDAMGGHVHYKLWVGSESEWVSELKNMDDEDEYVDSLQGFFEAANDPSWTRATSHPAGWKNFKNTVQRPPTDAEIMQFVRAVYSTGSKLDLPEGGMTEMGGVGMYSFRAHLRKLMAKYQGRVIKEYASRGDPMEAAAVTELADQVGDPERETMIQQAGATALKALDLLATAMAMPETSKAEKRAKEMAKRTAYQTVYNAGQTMRLTLDVHDDKVAFRQSVVQAMFDLTWGAIPGGGALTSAAKDLAKKGLDEMIKKASADDEPKKQADGIAYEFTRAANRLIGDGHLPATEGALAITEFEAVRR